MNTGPLPRIYTTKSGGGLPAGIHDPGPAALSRLIRPWLGASVNENTTGNISLTLEDAKESNAKTLATQQRTFLTL